MKRLATLAVLIGLTLVACGSDDDAAQDTNPADAPESIAPATDELRSPEPAGSESSVTSSATDLTGPVTIEHVYGETVIDGLPERIVSLDPQWTDVLTALGHAPIAAATDPIAGGWFPWQQADGIEPIEIASDYSIPFETIAALQPDLIVGSWGISDEVAYDTLSAMAPTIPLLGDRDVDPWEDMAAAAGEIFADPDAADALVADADQTAADLLAELPGLEGKTYTLVNYVPGDQIYVVADPDDGASQLFAKLGMQIDPDLLALDDGGFGRVELSFEEIGLLDADVLLILANGADTADIIGFDTLPAVQSGAYSVLEYAPVVGLNTPSPLSIPYSLDFIRPALAAAAAT